MHTHFPAPPGAAVVRCVLRANGNMFVGLLTPHTSSSLPDCLLLNVLPFDEDLRTATFPSFLPRPDKPEVRCLPTCPLRPGKPGWICPPG
jgi:hypothetical protein